MQKSNKNAPLLLFLIVSAQNTLYRAAGGWVVYQACLTARAVSLLTYKKLKKLSCMSLPVQSTSLWEYNNSWWEGRCTLKDLLQSRQRDPLFWTLLFSHAGWPNSNTYIHQSFGEILEIRGELLPCLFLVITVCIIHRKKAQSDTVKWSKSKNITSLLSVKYEVIHN